MSVAQDLRTFLLADATISGLIGTRLFPLRLPQNPTLPAMTYSWISGDRVHTMAGARGPSRPRLQFDAWAKTYLEAEAVFEALRKRLDGFQGTAGSVKVQGAFFASERDLYEDSADAGTGSGVGLYRRTSDFFVHYEE
jgi:hypothetical protein